MSGWSSSRAQGARLRPGPQVKTRPRFSIDERLKTLSSNLFGIIVLIRCRATLQLRRAVPEGGAVLP